MLKQDGSDFRQIIEDHSRPLYAHIRSIVLNHQDADDVLQNTFIKAWTNRESFRGDSELQTWLFRIATNEALQHLRKNRIRNLFFLRNENLKPDPYEPASQQDGERIKEKLEEAMKRLSPQQRIVFSMKYFNELKYSQMAEILQLAEGTLKATYHQAAKKIEQYLLENE